jgi:hypothetical protein
MRVDWEKIHGKDQTGVTTERLKVPGGWLVRSIYWRGVHEGGGGIAQSFIPDPNHEWGNEGKCPSP